MGLDQPNTLSSETFENLMLCLFLLYPKANRFVTKIPLEVVLYLQYHNSKATRRATDHNTFRSYLYLLSQNMFLYRKWCSKKGRCSEPSSSTRLRHFCRRSQSKGSWSLAVVKRQKGRCPLSGCICLLYKITVFVRVSWLHTRWFFIFILS